MKIQHIISLFLIVVVLSGCGEDKLSKIPAQGTILAFGDSLTAGVGVDKTASYPSVLAQLSGRQVVNAGISGEVTEQGLARLPDVLADTQPDLLVLLEGGNDILRSHNARRTKQNLAAMIELAQGQGVQVVLIGVPQKALFSDSAEFYKELAEQYQLVFEEDMIGDLLRDRDYKSDSIHFNQQGYRLMAEKVHQLLQENGAL